MSSIIVPPAPGSAVRPVQRGEEVVGSLERGRDGYAFSCALCGAVRRKKWNVDIRSAIETHLSMAHPVD